MRNSCVTMIDALKSIRSAYTLLSGSLLKPAASGGCSDPSQLEINLAM
jgi:hypothetical protein